MAGKIVTFGENLVRLVPDGCQRFSQANSVHTYYGGDASNVAVGLVHLGVPAAHVTKVPDNPLGHRAIQELRGYGVDTSHILVGGPRMGLYFMEQGHDARPSAITYDRAGSSFACSKRAEYDWDRILDGAWLFHFTGIAAALNDEVASICLDACKKAKEKGVLVSCDINYRSSLWPKEKASRTMTELCRYVDICFAQDAEIRDVFRITTDKTGFEGCEDLCAKMKAAFPMQTVAMTLLETINTDEYRMAGYISDGDKAAETPFAEIPSIDRVGPGDAFVAGALATFAKGGEAQEAVEMALAFSRLKFTVPGDVCLAGWEETKNLALHGGADVKR